MKALLFVSTLASFYSSAEAYGPCDSLKGWTMFRRYCYKVVNEWATFSEAEKKCQKEFAHLTSIHSQDENDFLRAMTRKGEIPKDAWSNDVWIGLMLHEHIGEWKWLDRSRLDYTNWARWEPNFNETEHYGAMMPDTSYHNYTLYNPHGGEWNNHDGRALRGYICKKHTFYPY